MALHESNYSTTWLSLSNGEFKLVTSENDPKAIARVTKAGKTVFEHPYKSVSGIITNLRFTENDYGSFFEVTLKDDKSYKFTLGIESGYFKSFFNFLPNINIEDEVTITAWAMENDGKTSVGVTVKQNGENVPPYFYQYDKEAKKTLFKNNFPEFKGKFVKSKWAMYKLEIADFLREWFEKQNYTFDAQQEAEVPDDVPEKEELPF